MANSTWGSWLAELGVPGIYRSQASLAPGVKVRMSTKALPHAGMGVPSYAWATSPLRRYVDLVNQWQIIACARHGPPPRWPRPSSPRMPTCSAIISSFDARLQRLQRLPGGHGALLDARATWSKTASPSSTARRSRDEAAGGSFGARGRICPWSLPCWARKAWPAARAYGSSWARPM